MKTNIFCKRFVAILTIVAILTSLSGVAFATDTDNEKVLGVVDLKLESVLVTTQGQKYDSLEEYSLSNANKRILSNEEITVEQTSSAIIEITKTGEVHVVDEVPITPFSSTSQSEENVYYKATCTVTYTVSNSYVTFTKASGSWTQLRGTTTVSDREVYYGVNSYAATKYPTENSFSYTTDFPAVLNGSLTSIGCSSSISIQLGTLSMGKLLCNCYVEPYLNV